MKVDELSLLTGGLDWPVYFKALGTPAFDDVNVAEPGFFKAFAPELAQMPLSAWKTYLRWHLIRRAAPFLGAAWVSPSGSRQNRLACTGHLFWDDHGGGRCARPTLRTLSCLPRQASPCAGTTGHSRWPAAAKLRMMIQQLQYLRSSTRGGQQ